MKKFFFFFLFLFCSFFCSGANFEDLSNDDAGQLLYSPEYAAIFVFQKGAAPENGIRKWECRPLLGSGIFKLHPSGCIILNYTEQTLTPDAIVTELTYWSCKNQNRAAAFRKIAERTNSPVTNKTLDFYSKLSTHIRSIHHEINEFHNARRKAQQQQSSPQNNQTSGLRPWSSRRPKSTSVSTPFLSRNRRNTGSSSNSSNSSGNQNSNDMLKLLESGLKGSLKNMALADIFKEIATKEKNIFVSFCMYLRYRELTLRAARSCSAELQKELYQELNQIGDEILVAYQQQRNSNKKRENDFRKICRDKHGRWAYAPPADQNAMCRFVEYCYKSWQKTFTMSPYSEFPEWGNAMLEVLQMIKNPAWEQKFDAAYAEYQKYNSN